MAVGVSGDGGFHFIRLKDLLFDMAVILDKKFNNSLTIIKNMIKSKKMIQFNCSDLPHLILFNPETGEKIDWETIYNCFIENNISPRNIKNLNCIQERLKSYLPKSKLSESTNNLIVKDKFTIFMQAMNDYLNSNSECLQAL